MGLIWSGSQSWLGSKAGVEITEAAQGHAARQATKEALRIFNSFYCVHTHTHTLKQPKAHTHTYIQIQRLTYTDSGNLCADFNV